MQDLKGGRYTLTKPLGEGSQGETWEAVDRREGRLVAIKAFRVGKAKAWKDVELAEREARTLASLSHPNLPKYVEHFEEEGTLYLVMERIEGESLAVVRKSGRVLGAGDVRRLLDDAAKALAYLHGAAPPIIHRDLKPGNVIRRKDGSYAFVDFGSVRDRLKLEGGSTVTGTFGYMAPEQFQGRASPASDVYGIGATALAMLTGREPEDLPHKGLGIDVASALPSTTPTSLVKSLEAMLDPDPDKRASTIAEALRRGGTASVPPPQVQRVDFRPSRREERARRRAERREQRRRGHGNRSYGLAIAAMVLGILAIVNGGAGAIIPLGIVLVLLLRNVLRARKARLAEEEARYRVAEEHDILRRVRAVSPQQAQAEAMRRERVDAEQWADEEADFHAENWEEPEAWKKKER